MKIIQLVYALGPGGAEHLVVDLANELAIRGHDVIVCAILDCAINPELYTYGIRYLDSKVKYVNLFQIKGFNLKKKDAIVRFIESEHPDVVHLHLNSIPYIAGLAFRRKDIKFVYTFHSVADNASGGTLQYPLNYFLFRFGKLHPVTISKECDLSYKKYYHLANSSCITNGRKRLSPTSLYANVRQKIESLKSKQSTKVFVHLARLNPQKNQEMLVQAFNRLDEMGYDFVLLMMGYKLDGDEASFLRNIACRKIFFFGNQDNVSDYLYCADAFCLSSLYEGLPISLIEAVSCGCVPICTPVGGVPDVVKDGDTGFLSADVTLDAYVATLMRYLEDPGVVSRERLERYYEENFSIEKTASNYLRVYGKC